MDLARSLTRATLGAAATTGTLLLGAAGAQATHCQSATATFASTEGQQCYVVGAHVSELVVKLVGGQGGNASDETPPTQRVGGAGGTGNTGSSQQALLCGDSGHASTLAIGGNPTALAGDLSLGLGGGGGGGGYYGGGAGGSGGCGNHGSNAGGGGGGAGSSFALATGLITNVVVATDTRRSRGDDRPHDRCRSPPQAPPQDQAPQAQAPPSSTQAPPRRAPAKPGVQ